MPNDSFAGQDDVLVFSEDQDSKTAEVEEKWKVLIVDDEPDVHSVTKWVLKEFTYHRKNVDFLSAYTRTDAIDILNKNPDVAVILLDVVMEEHDTGLRLVDYIRNELKNKHVRIILRTGQAGEAPEGKVIVEYDINDYKEKTELTAQKLTSALIVALRTYCDIETIETNRKGLEQIIDASPTLFEFRSMQMLASGILTQVTSLLNLDSAAMYCKSSSFAAVDTRGKFIVLAAVGDFERYINSEITCIQDENVIKIFDEARRSDASRLNAGNSYAFRVKSNIGSEGFIYFSSCHELSELDRKLVDVYFTNVSAAFDNLHLNKEIEDTLKEIIFNLGEVIESRSHETGNHVRRVSEYTYHLALKFGLDPQEAENLKLASILHDVGKIGVPDCILNKPGPLTPEEFEVVKKHTLIGHTLLRSSRRDVLKTAALIAHQHHERYDGTGYPQGLKGEAIHPFGRICALADVFDALSNDRVYKTAWSIDEVVRYIMEQRGKQFDPRLVDIFVELRETFLGIWAEYRD